MNSIDRTSAEPFYVQLARIIERRIRDGSLKVGDRLPAEMELCRTYDLARSTVRDTFRALEQQQLIRIVPRRGAFVTGANDNRWMLQVTEGFLETAAHSPDATIETAVIRAGTAPLPIDASSALELPEGTVGFTLERLRRVNGVPAIHSTNWLPVDVGVLLEGLPVLDGRTSLNATLRSLGYSTFFAQREVAAIASPPATARNLEMSRNAPILRIRSTSKNAAGRPFDYYESLVRSDVVTLSVAAEATG